MDKPTEKDVHRKQISEFLRSRRARIAPNDVGLSSNGRRRTPGLRREEVAQLAGVSVDWYTWLEQGRDIHASEQVLTSIARILRLDDAETRYLFTLAHGNGTALKKPVSDGAARKIESVSPVLQAWLDSLDTTPAVIIDQRWDILAWNPAYCALFVNLEATPPDDHNALWLVFTNTFLRQILVDWDAHMMDVVAQFRADYGRNPGDPRCDAILNRVMAVSPQFRTWWPLHEVQDRHHRRKEYHHPLVGNLVTEENTFGLAEYPGLRMVLFIPMPGTPTAERLRQLIKMGNTEAFELA